MKIFLTGASGYIGGSVAAALTAYGHHVTGLVRSPEKADAVRAFGVEPVFGTLAETELLARMAGGADAVINTASADDRGAVEAMLPALRGSDRLLLHTSGSSIVGDLSAGEPGDAIYDEETPFEPHPGRATRVANDHAVLAATDEGVRAVVICPSLIYGRGRGANPDSIQIPWLIALAKKHGVGRHVGRGENRWSNVHIDDLVDLYLLALEKAPAGAFYYAENGENSMREAAEAISRMLGFGGGTRDWPLQEAIAEWGESAAQYTFGSNSRVRAVRARRELGWSPAARSLIEEIEHGVYAEAAC